MWKWNNRVACWSRCSFWICTMPRWHFQEPTALCWWRCLLATSHFQLLSCSHFQNQLASQVKSTRFNFAVVVIVESPTQLVVAKLKVQMAWEREDCAFMIMALDRLHCVVSSNITTASATLFTRTCCRSSTYVSLLIVSLNGSDFLFGKQESFNKS